MGVLSVVLFLFTAVTAFTNINLSTDEDNTCTVTVIKGNSVVSYTKVSTEVSGGISCIGGRDFETDKNGVVILKWSKGCNLKKVYVKGTGYSVDYKNGGRYSLMIK